MNADSVFRNLFEPELLSFYGWWQMSVCLFAFFALIAIWWHIGRKQKDFGQVWLALSILCWSFSGAVEVYFANQLRFENEVIVQNMEQLINTQQHNNIAEDRLSALVNEIENNNRLKQGLSFKLDGWRSILSLFNSLFILLALPWFRYLPKRIEPIIKSGYWQVIVGLPFLFSLLPTINKMFSGMSIYLISELDVYYAILTLVFLGLVLWQSFKSRRLYMLAWLSIVCILITLVAQIYKLTGSDIDGTLFSAIFKTSLIMIFFALALSWVKELSENVIPNAQQLFLALSIRKTESGKPAYLAKIKGIPGINEREVSLTPALFELLLKFVKRRTGLGEGWLEIKPKGIDKSLKAYDIKDHNELKRLLNALLDGLFGKGSWTKNQHEQPLKKALFEMSEKRERLIRLALPASHLSFPDH